MGNKCVLRTCWASSLLDLNRKYTMVLSQLMTVVAFAPVRSTMTMDDGGDMVKRLKGGYACPSNRHQSATCHIHCFPKLLRAVCFAAVRLEAGTPESFYEPTGAQQVIPASCRYTHGFVTPSAGVIRRAGEGQTLTSFTIGQGERQGVPRQ